ncbi:LOW QUALITY PROTEIN: hypothetical protein TorRG33x02_179290 [Trema orientale]|uniref:Uncharacterized protein n=1 Tax=Trema orientale TaxID=63057 RepID=A0A2P5EKY5_TREOI|nr:LOW QUALITY PROTEIN: hypothetical protein TorRG33x02_179290 [Trema orientale]
MPWKGKRNSYPSPNHRALLSPKTRRRSRLFFPFHKPNADAAVISEGGSCWCRGCNQGSRRLIRSCHGFLKYPCPAM